MLNGDFTLVSGLCNFVSDRINDVEVVSHNSKEYKEQEAIYRSAIAKAEMRLGKDKFTKAYLPIEAAITAMECIALEAAYRQGMRDAMALQAILTGPVDKSLHELREELREKGAVS